MFLWFLLMVNCSIFFCSEKRLLSVSFFSYCYQSQDVNCLISNQEYANNLPVTQHIAALLWFRVTNKIRLLNNLCVCMWFEGSSSAQDRGWEQTCRAGGEAASVCSPHTRISNRRLCRSRSAVHPESSAAQEGVTTLERACESIDVYWFTHFWRHLFQGHICSVNELLGPVYSYLWIRPQISRQQLEEVTSEAANIITAVIQ